MGRESTIHQKNKVIYGKGREFWRKLQTFVQKKRIYEGEKRDFCDLNAVSAAFVRLRMAATETRGDGKKGRFKPLDRRGVIETKPKDWLLRVEN